MNRKWVEHSTSAASLPPSVKVFDMRVITACDGLEALDLFQQHVHEIHLVLMDLTMPRMDGREAFLAMRSLRPEIPVILSSGYDEQSAFQELESKGLAAFLPKPFQLKELRRLLTEVMERTRTQQPC